MSSGFTWSKGVKVILSPSKGLWKWRVMDGERQIKAGISLTQAEARAKARPHRIKAGKEAKELHKRIMKEGKGESWKNECNVVFTYKKRETEK